MAVQREHYGPTEVAVSGDLAGILSSLVRRPDGRWTFILKVDGEAELSDGRRIRVSRHIGIPATEQIGRKRADWRQ